MNPIPQTQNRNQSYTSGHDIKMKKSNLTVEHFSSLTGYLLGDFVMIKNEIFRKLINAKCNSFSVDLWQEAKSAHVLKEKLPDTEEYSSSLSIYNVHWTDLFLSAARGKSTCLLSP